MEGSDEETNDDKDGLGLYEMGLGTQRNNLIESKERYDKAFKLFLKSALQKNKFAQFRVGLAYFTGIGATMNLSEAKYWIEKSAEQKYREAQYLLGRIYSKGVVDRSFSREDGKLNYHDIKKGEYYYLEAASQGHSKAQFELALLYSECSEENSQNEKNSRRWLGESSKNGYELAGLLYDPSLEKLSKILIASQIGDYYPLGYLFKMAFEEYKWLFMKCENNIITRTFGVDWKTSKQTISESEFSLVCSGILEGRPVAVKTLNKLTEPQDKKLDQKYEVEYKESLSEFLKETRIAFSVPDHPHIIKTFAFCLNPFAIIQELAETNLSDWSVKYYDEQNDEVELTTVIRYLMEICEGMEHLHKNRVIHRDLACRNVLMTPSIKDGRKMLTCKIGDFGMSRQASSEVKASDGTITIIKGTGVPIRWMSPEQISSSLDSGGTWVEYSLASDVWSFGCLIYELLSGKAPYYLEMNDIKLKQEISIGRSKLNRPPECPIDLWREVVQECLKYNKDERPSFTDLKNWITRISNNIHPDHKIRISESERREYFTYTPEESITPENSTTPENSILITSTTNPQPETVIDIYYLRSD